MGGINKRQRLEQTKGPKETQGEGSRELDGRGPSLEKEDELLFTTLPL